MGAPRPIGIPEALNSITAPHEEPAFLIARMYFSQSFSDFLSGQKNGFFLISFSFQFFLLHPRSPYWFTAPIILNFFPKNFF